jgi:hypothetical protein
MKTQSKTQDLFKEVVKDQIAAAQNAQNERRNYERVAEFRHPWPTARFKVVVTWNDGNKVPYYSLDHIVKNDGTYVLDEFEGLQTLYRMLQKRWHLVQGFTIWMHWGQIAHKTTNWGYIMPIDRLFKDYRHTENITFKVTKHGHNIVNREPLKDQLQGLYNDKIKANGNKRTWKGSTKPQLKARTI